MKLRVFLASFVIALLGGALLGAAGELTTVLRFSESDLVFTEVGEYDLVRLGDHALIGEVGEPLLPLVNCSVIIPPTAELKRLEVLSSEWVELPGEWLIHPAQEPVPISAAARPAFVGPDPATYSSSTPYPGEITELCRTGSMGGYRIGGFLLRPLQYTPSERVLRLCTSIELRMVYEDGAVSLEPKTERQRQVFGERAGRMVLNPEDVERWAPPPREPKQGTTEYAIVTTDTYVSALQPFADWKTKKGVPAEIKTISWINSSYGGHYDTQENIREFLKDYYANNGLIWILLAGDTPLVPHRIARVVTGQGTGNLPCDLYFSDLDGTWDANGNHIYGEVPGDNVDMYADVYVGRASIDNATQASTFLSKVSTFEKNPPTDYLKKICLPAVLLWPGYHGDVVNNSIANYTPTGWQDVKLYESNGTLSRSILINHLNQGYQFCHGAAHGSSSGWYYYYGSTLLNSADAYGLTNGNKLTVVNSIACIAGGFDMGDCQAEQFVLNPNGGAVACIQNSREGWGTPPSMGPSERLDAKFYSKLFWDHVFQIGETHAGSKDYFVPQAQGDEYMRWCVYELNLFGDPNMPMWTETPVAMTVDHPHYVPPGPQNFAVSVTDGRAPIENALVCVMNSTVYEHGYTNGSGEITFSIDPSEDDTLQVTSTAYNYYPYEGECLVTVGVKELVNDQLLITNFQLHQNQPNPFSHTTTIRYCLPSAVGGPQTAVSLAVYDLSGRLVKTLVDGVLPTSYSLPVPSEVEGLPTSVVWDGRDDSGRPVAGGVYLCTMDIGDLRATKSMVLLR